MLAVENEETPPPTPSRKGRGGVLDFRDGYKFLASKGFTPIAPKILWPAEHLVDVFGEELKKRLFLTTNLDGVEYALRPDFTVPVALSFMEAGLSKAQYSYCGTVFRQRDDGQSGECVQTGVEDFGAMDFAAKDAEILALAIELCGVQGASNISIEMGDAGLFTAMLKAVNCPAHLAAKLKQDLGRLDRLAEDLQAGKSPAFQDETLVKLKANLISQKPEKALEILAAKFTEQEPIGNRTPADIVARLHMRKRGSEASLSPEQIAAIRSYIQIEIPLSEALKALQAYFKSHSIKLSLEAFEARIQAFEKAGIDTSKIIFSGSFGRRLNYYSGFMFNITLPQNTPDKPLAGGGRYDGLLTMLGHSTAVPAVGFALWNERAT